MSITAKVHITHERLALVPTLRRLGDVEIRVITQGTTNPGATAFPFLFEYPDRAALEASLDADPTVDSYDLIDWTDQTGVYYIEHTSETKLISSVVADVGGFLVKTETGGNGWNVRLLLPDRSALNSIWTYAADNDIDLDIVELYGNDDSGTDSSYGLTDEQKVALQTAFERGFYEEPRDSSLSDVADELGLSSTAMSGRLRRGTRNLIAATIADIEDES
ncbi:helix-turn-helix domain-containing protein [Halobium palmae]|uniref:Helix-turn-helix domain-containing protein n=1 Tax=Halobium palmae TaxID=1776492 RepID=A0ABD5RZ88_9EURY